MRISNSSAWDFALRCKLWLIQATDDSDLGILVENFFSSYDTRVLLLSATPYKLYSTSEEIETNQSELVPYWCFGKNQSVKIEWLVPMYPMSRDAMQYERLMKILSLYRLTLGQARQEELLEYLLGEFDDAGELKGLFMDLSPFGRREV